VVFDLSPGDGVRIGDGVILKVLAVEGDLVRFGLESPERWPGAGMDCEVADPKPKRVGWELN
jgi:hypothetical protein